MVGSLRLSLGFLWRLILGIQSFNLFLPLMELLQKFPSHCLLLLLLLPLQILRDLVSSQLLSSDHFILSFEVLTANTRQIKRACNQLFFDFNKTNFDGLSSFLLDTDFGPLLLLSDVECVWSFLREVILYCISLFTPQIRVRTHPYPVWFHSGVRHQLNKTHSARKLCKRNPSTHNLLHLSSAEHQLQCVISDAKARYEDRLV